VWLSGIFASSYDPAMPVPRIAIVGRPNVGKSSLLNLIARERISIVDDQPGVTRDRVCAIVDLDSPVGSGPERSVELVDTGGFGVYVADGARYDDAGRDLARLTGQIEAQIALAVESADLILFAVDAQAGITPRDREIATLLRERRLGGQGGEPPEPGPGGVDPDPQRQVPVSIRVVATKVDGPKWETHAYELSALGFGEPMMCSATSKYLRRAMLDALYETVGGLPSARAPEPPAADLKLAIVGKRNAGKSTLVNTLAGQDRVIVSEIAGTTRDAVDVHVQRDGRSLLVIDTAGLRRRRSMHERVEHYAVLRAHQSIRRADVVFLLIDATTPISQVDEQLAALVVESYKPVILVVNKWDLVEGRVGPNGRPLTPEVFESYLRDELKGLSFAPISLISARDGLNVSETIDLAHELLEQARARVGTGPLNRVVREILEARGPSTKLGKRIKIYYVSQVGTCPPTIALVVNRPEAFNLNYQRYMLNRFRERLDFPEVPIRLLIRRRRRDEARQGLGEEAARGAGADRTEPRTAESYFED